MTDDWKAVEPEARKRNVVTGLQLRMPPAWMGECIFGKTLTGAEPLSLYVESTGKSGNAVVLADEAIEGDGSVG